MGHKEDGDGWKYRGLGIIQVTWKANFEVYGEMIKISDLATDPEKYRNNLDVQVEVGCAFWEGKGINILFDEKNDQ